MPNKSPDGAIPPSNHGLHASSTHGPSLQIGQDSILVPSEPPHSVTEAAALHSRIIEVKNRWGVSYRDAAYILFLVTADVANERTKLGEALKKHSQNIEIALSLLSTDDLPGSSTDTPPPTSACTPSKSDDASKPLAPSPSFMARGRGRPRLYHSPEEQQMANRAKSNRSYEKRRLLVNTRRTVRYRHEKERKRGEAGAAAADDAPLLDPTTVPEWMAHLKGVNERFKKVKNGTVRNYIENLCQEYLTGTVGSCDSFEAALLELGSLDLSVERCHAAVLRLDGPMLLLLPPSMEFNHLDHEVIHRGGLSAREVTNHVTVSVDLASLESYCGRGTDSNEKSSQDTTTLPLFLDRDRNDLDDPVLPTLASQPRRVKEAAIINLPTCDFSTFPHVSTAWTASRSRESETSSSQLPPHFRLLRSDRAAASGGAILLLDNRRRVIAVVAPGPQGSVPCDWGATIQRSTSAIRQARDLCTFEKDDIDHRRGSFPALAIGITRGPGSCAPTGRTSTTKKNQTALGALIRDPSIRHLAELQSSFLHTHAPDLGRYYRSTLDAVVAHNPRLKRNFKNSDFASLTVNFGPQTVCEKHRDVCNLAWGWCAVTALGNYDHRKGGHMVLWDFGLVIEFPPGYTILVPSASVDHSNTPIGPDETRYSVTQYTGGKVFRWVNNDFQMEKDVPPSTTEEKRKRWMDGIAMFKTL
ncbi:hypothetical protein ONZ45_g18402 [Pleurotus djamor]|nr:hypothetical protein ONZ45_g18402 [Pleurotus djamor]